MLFCHLWVIQALVFVMRERLHFNRSTLLALGGGGLSWLDSLLLCPNRATGQTERGSALMITSKQPKDLDRTYHLLRSLLLEVAAAIGVVCPLQKLFTCYGGSTPSANSFASISRKSQNRAASIERLLHHRFHQHRGGASPPG
jgi:hypothetical protein